MPKNHRGRFQAQGENLQESENWAITIPLKFKPGKELLSNLSVKLSEKEYLKRKESFKKCHSFIKNLNKNGGYDVKACGKPLIMSFPCKKVRVDLEVNLGKAFI